LEFFLVYRDDFLCRAVEGHWGHVFREEGPLTGDEDWGRARELEKGFDLED
jgi:peptide methionine sulfoxide reductase MsrB